MLPLGPTPTINRFLKIKHELIGRAEGEAFTGGILTKEQASVVNAQVMMVWPC